MKEGTEIKCNYLNNFFGVWTENTLVEKKNIYTIYGSTKKVFENDIIFSIFSCSVIKPVPNRLHMFLVLDCVR